MTFAGWFTIVAFVVVLTVLAFPLGSYMAKVYTGERVLFSHPYSPVPSASSTASSGSTRSVSRTGRRTRKA